MAGLATSERETIKASSRRVSLETPCTLHVEFSVFELFVTWSFEPLAESFLLEVTVFADHRPSWVGCLHRSQCVEEFADDNVSRRGYVRHVIFVPRSAFPGASGAGVLICCSGLFCSGFRLVLFPNALVKFFVAQILLIISDLMLLGVASAFVVVPFRRIIPGFCLILRIIGWRSTLITRHTLHGWSSMGKFHTCGIVETEVF